MWVISWRVNVTFSIATKLNQTAPYLYKWARVWATVIHYRKSVQWALLQFAEFLFIMDFLWIFVIFIKWSHRERHNKDQTEMEGRKEWDWVLDKRIASMHVWKRFRWICSTHTHTHTNWLVWRCERFFVQKIYNCTRSIWIWVSEWAHQALYFHISLNESYEFMKQHFLTMTTNFTCPKTTRAQNTLHRCI